MDPSRESPDMSPVDKDGGGVQSESIFQPTEKTDEEKTIRLTSAEETAPTATDSNPGHPHDDSGANRGQQEITDTQPPLADRVTNTEKPSVDESVKESTDSKCDTVKDSLSNNVQVQIETTNNSDETSSVAVESISSSFDSKIDDEKILIPNNPQPDPSYLSEDVKTPSLSVGAEKNATKDDMKCEEDSTRNLASTGESEGEKLLIPSIEEKRPSSSEVKTSSLSSEDKPLSASEEKPHSESSEKKFPSTSEKKTSNSPSEEKPNVESFEKRHPNTSEEKAFSSTSEENPHSESCEKKLSSISEEKTRNPPAKEKAHSESSEKKPPSTSEETTISTPSEEKLRSELSEKKPHSKTEEKTCNSPSEKTYGELSEAKFPNSSEEKTSSSPSEEKPHSESFEKKPPSKSEEKSLNSLSKEKFPSTSDVNTFSSPSEEKPHSESCEKKPSSTSEEKSEKLSSAPENNSHSTTEEKNSNTSSKEIIPSALFEEKQDDGKAPSSPTESCVEKEVTSPSSAEKSDEEKVPNLPSESLCGEVNDVDRSQENILSEGERNGKENHSLYNGKNYEEITPRSSSEKKHNVEMSSSPSIEEKCDGKLPSSSPPSEDKIIVEKAPSPSHEHTTQEEKTAKLLAFDGKPENSDSKSNSRGEKVCSTVSNRSEVHPSSVENNDKEQEQDKCSSDVTANISSEVVGEKVENESKSGNSITDEESKKSTADFEKCKNEEKQKSTDLMENCEDAKATKNVCQLLDESNKTGVDEDESKKMSDFNNEDKSTNEISVVDAGASADNQCALDTKLKTHNSLEDDSSNSKKETDDVTGGDKVPQNEIDKLSKSDGKACENEIDESIKSDIKVSQNKIPDSISSDDSPLLCAEDNEKVKNNVSITSTEVISSADLCKKNDVENVSQNTNDENSKSVVSLSKFDDGLNSMHDDILIPSDQQETSNPEEAESNTSKNAKPITLKAWAKGLVSSTKEPSSIEKCDNSSLLCDEILDKSEEDCIASSHVANVSKDSPPNPEDENVDGEKAQYVIEDSKACLSSKLAENLSAVKTDDVMQSPSGEELQSTLEKKVDPLNVADDIKVTISSVEELPECVNTGNESNKDVVPKLASIENDNSGNPGQKQTPGEDIQITGNKKELRRNRNRNKNKKEELNVAPDNVCNSRTETATVQIEETVNDKNVTEESVETYVSNSQPSMVNKSNDSIQITANKKLATGGSLVVNKTSITPYLENIAVNNTGDSSSQIDQKRNDSPGATSLLCADTVKIKSDGKKKAKTVRRKSVKCETNHVSNSRINRTPLPILPKPPIASTSTFVGNSNAISVPLKVSKGTATDASTERPHKPLILSQMDVQRIAEMKPTNPQVINPDQLHKNICIIKTLKPGTQGGENDARPKKVSIDCQVDESELSPVGPYQSAVNELSARKGSAPAATNPNNHIVVTVRGTFANAANHSSAPSVPVKIDNAVNTLANQERISDAVKFFFQGPTNLDKFFAPSTHQPNSAEATEISQNVVPSVKEQCGMQQASFKLDKNRATTSKKKVVTDMKKFTPILPKPPGMLGRGEYSMDSSQKVDGHVLPATQQTSSLLSSYAAVEGGGSKLQQVVDKLYMAQESAVMAQDSNDHRASADKLLPSHVDKIDLTTDSPKRQLQPTKEFLSNLKLPSNLTVIPQKVKKPKMTGGSVRQTIQPPTDKVEGSVFARLQALGTVIEVERDVSDKQTASRSETSSPSATPNAATQPDYAQCLRVLDNLTQAGQILASIKKVNPKTAAKSKTNMKPLPNLKKIEVPSTTNKTNLQRRSSLPSDAINRSSPGLAEPTAIRPATPSEVSSRVPAINLNENEHCLKIASNPELTIIPKKHVTSQGPPAASTPPPTTVAVVAAPAAGGIECPPFQKTLHFEQQLNCPPTISITTEESGGRKQADEINVFRFRLDVSQVREKSSGERVLTCDICSAEYPKVASLKRHYLRKHINVRYISEQDKQSYLAPSKNKNAAEPSCQKSNAEEGLYKCSSCRQCFNEKNDLKNHMFEQHILGSDEFKTYECSKCSNTFDNIKVFVAHRKICSQKLAPPPPPVSVHLCLYCEQSFVNIAARNKHHNKSHHFKKRYQKCCICNSDKYRDKSSLFKHMCTEHKSEYFGCEHCHFRFTMKAHLERHNELKHGFKKPSSPSSTTTNEDANPKPMNEDNKVEDNLLPSENESTEVTEKVEIQTKLIKNGNTEINSKYELAKMLVRVGPPNATTSEIPDKTADNKAKNDCKTKAANKKKPQPKTAKDKSKSVETKEVGEKEKIASTTEDNKVVENTKLESQEKESESNTKAEKKKKPVTTHKCSICNKVFGSSSNVTRHKRLTHGLLTKRKSPVRKVKINQKVNVFTKSETADHDDEPDHPVLHNVYGDAENLGHNENNPNSITRNVKENLLHHLDGKLDSQEVMENDVKSRAVAVPKRRLSFSASFPSCERESEHKGSEGSKEGGLPISPKSSIEKYGFPKNYDGCGGLTSYYKDMSHLDLFTRKAMRFTPQNASLEQGGASASEFNDIPTCLELVKTERSGEDDGGCVEVELSGEWTRPRRYICAVCSYCTGELWDIEEHKLAVHPNVWCPHNEVLVEEAECWRVVYHKRHLSKIGVLGGTPPPSPPQLLRCTKCLKASASLPDFHRHVLDCGGDTTWAITMLGVSSPGNRRNRKWRPFGSRRRRQQGRRGLKRNIPNTPAKQPGVKIRTKPGDMETIQRMIANLPAKRVSRRVFGDDNEVKTRSQGTISSGSIYSTPFTYQFNNKTAALAKKQAAKLIKPKTNEITQLLIDSPKKDEKKSKSTADASEKLKKSKTSPGKESSAESPSHKKLKSPDKNKSGTSEKTAEANTQVKNVPKRDHSKVDKNISSGKEDNLGTLDAKKKQKVKHNVFSVKEGSSGKNNDKSTASGKSKLQTTDSAIGDNKSIVEADKNEDSNPSTSVSRSKAASKPTKQDPDKQKRSSDDFRKSLDDFRKRMCIDGNLIMCSGCGTQFDNSSACQRHMKKCSYCTGKAAGGLACAQCNTSFSSEALKLAHVCDDRAMPQLSPEEPYPNQVPAATEDIPVLSPEEIGKNKSDNNSDDAKKGPRLTRSESRASISEAGKNEKRFSEEGKSQVMTRNSRSGLRQKPLSELNKSVHDEASSLDSSDKQIGRVLRHRSITSLSGPDDDGDDSKTIAAKTNESSSVSVKNQQKSTAARGKKRPLDEDDAATDNDKDDEENSVRRETRRGQISNKNTNQGTSEDKDEVISNENRRKSMRLSLPSESTSSTSFEKKANDIEVTEKSSRKSLSNEESQTNTLKVKISLEFLKETSETGERQGKRFLCEVCDKVIMEIYLRKHVESGAHSRNVEMRKDFDNLFPDPRKFTTSCSICNISFSSSFMSYIHQLRHHEDSLMEMIESSMIEPMEIEIKEEVEDHEDDDDEDESLIKTKQKMSKKASEGKRKMDDSSTNVNRSKVDSNKSKTNTKKGADASSTEPEKTSSKRKSVNSSIHKVNEKAPITINKVDKSTTGSSLGDVTIKSEDTTSEKRALRARRSSLPNEPTIKSEDNMILNPELTLLREGRRSSLRLDSSLGKAKETVEASEIDSCKNESMKESAVANTDLQLRGRRSLTIAGPSSNIDTGSTQISKSSLSINDSIGECDDGLDSSTREAPVDDPPTESGDQESGVLHEASEFVNKNGKAMMFCFVCDRSVGKSAYKKHSNSVVHKQNTKFRKEFQEKYADSTVMTCRTCRVDFTHSYLCFRHTMELHPETVAKMFDTSRTTRSLSSKEEKQVTKTDSNKKTSNEESPTILIANKKMSNEELPTTQLLSNNKTSSEVETPSSQTVSKKKTPKAKNETSLVIDSKKNSPTIPTSKEVVQTKMFEFFKKAPTFSLKEDTSKDLKNTNEATQITKTASSKKSVPISSDEKPITLPEKNVDVTPTAPCKVETTTSPFDFINETSAPILSYREVTQSKSKNFGNNRKSSVNSTVSTKDVKDDKERLSHDLSKISNKPLPSTDATALSNRNEKIVIPKISPSTEIDSKISLSSSTLKKKAVDNTPKLSGKELEPKELTDVINPDKHDTESGESTSENILIPEVDPAEVKPANTLFCATCHKRVKIESLQKHSTSTSHKINHDQSNFEYEVPADCDKCKTFENFPFACRAHQKSVLKSKKKSRKTSSDEVKLAKSLLGKMSKKKLNKLKKRQKLKQSEKLAETKMNRLKKMKINNWQVSVVKKEENEKSEKKATSTVTSQQIESQSRSTSEFDCLLCHKHFNSALLLVEHQNTTVHKMNASRHALQNNPLPTLPSTIIPSLVKNLPPSTLTQVPVPSPKETEGNFGYSEQTPFSNTTSTSSSSNVGTDHDLSQAAGEAILAYGWQDTDWSSVRRASGGWDNQSVAGSSSSGIPDTNMSAFWETDVTSSFMGGRSSLGSILDSVNKILADPDLSTYPHYNLTDLQSEVGAYHDDMLGERSNFLQEMSMRAETSRSNSSSVQENWSYPPSVDDGSTATLMDLDNQPAPTPNPPTTIPTPEVESPVGQFDPKRIKLSTDMDKNPPAAVKRARKRKSSVDSEGSNGSSKGGMKYQTPVDYEAKATVCLTCGRHYVGLVALQLHMSSCSDINSKTTANLAFLKRKSVVNTPFDSSLVCQRCKEILNSREALRNHVCHLRTKSELRSRSENSNSADPINKEGAEKFKSKMSIALGTLLDKALNNLLGAKSNQEPDLSTGAIQLLGKLCAVRRKSQQNMTSSAASGGKSSNADAAGSASASQTSGGSNLLDHRTLNFKTSAKLRSVLAGEQNLPKLPWLTGTGAAGTASATAAKTIALLPPSPETIVDHLAVMLANRQDAGNSYDCPVCGETFSMPSARNNHMYMHQETAPRPRPLPASNPDERSQSSQNQNNPSEKDWRGVASSSCDSDFGAENAEGQQASTIRTHCPECGLAFSNQNEILVHRREIHPNPCAGDGDSRPVSENIIDSTSGDENRAKMATKSAAGGGASGEKALPALEPIAAGNPQATAERLRKRPMRRGGSQEENVSERMEMAVQTDCEEEEAEDDEPLRKRLLAEHANKTAAKQRLMVLAPEDVRVKAEAALRELSLQKSINKTTETKYVSGERSCKYGNYRYTKNAEDDGSTKSRFVHFERERKDKIEKKWKSPPSSDAAEDPPSATPATSQNPIKIEIKTEVHDLPSE